MNASSRFLALAAVGGAIALAACGGTDLSPVASTTAIPGDSGSFTSSGNGPGAPPSPAPSPGTGTCTNDCDGTGPGPGAGNGYGQGNGYGTGGGGNGYGPGPGPGDGLCGNACTGPVGPDPANIQAILDEALQEEYGARYLYEHVLAKLGPDTLPFSLIAPAEAQHVEALTLLFQRRELPVPGWAPRPFPAFTTLPEACRIGVAAERADAAFYDKYLLDSTLQLPLDVTNVFKNLQRASLENHLPAFERCQ